MYKGGGGLGAKGGRESPPIRGCAIAKSSPCVGMRERTNLQERKKSSKKASHPVEHSQH